MSEEPIGATASRQFELRDGDLGLSWQGGNAKWAEIGRMPERERFTRSARGPFARSTSTFVTVVWGLNWRHCPPQKKDCRPSDTIIF